MKDRANPQLVELAPDECLVLLERARFGRVAFADGGRVVVFPVNYLLDRPYVVFRSTEGSKLEAALRAQEATFEADATDPLYHGGWSVLAHGPLDVVESPEEIERLEQLPLRSWWSGASDRWVRLRVDEVTGRRLR